ncbi:VWA domain-containing protein [Arenimonas caeni]|uniref:VWFA domain-containing protein n=1 Tax=Arenimonas caeni TaxID=2058085 RepID=A0A2P6M7B1_9GAMM|nr:VWA domain-containing protein [Arenimonas caeni]PRH81886.1 hypothetical protein C6N40_10335 [Arenimonas caeni]
MSLRPALSLLALSLAFALPAAQAGDPAADGGQALLVLDASGSMWGQIGGQPKITIAREAIDAMLAGWPGGDLGLMAYGHRRKGDCADIELLQPVGAFDADAVRRRVGALQPRGMTPITAAVRQAAEHLKFTEQKATVILVSDGEETCSADPCALGEELEALGVDFTAHVVGFDIEEGSRAQAQLQCLAANTGGRYLAARDAGELGDALGDLAEAAPAAPSLAVKSADAWIPGFVLEADTSETLDGEAGGATTVHEFSVDQDAKACQAMCEADAGCQAWHYEPTGSYFVEFPRCHLKDGVFSMRLREEGEGFVAGVKPGVKLIRDDAP